MQPTLLLIALQAFLIPCEGAGTPQDDWIFPINAQYAQPSSIVSNGETISIQWNSDLQFWWPDYNPYANVQSSDLWITGYDLHQYQHLVAPGVNVNQTRSVSWTVQLPSNEVNIVTNWVFRFMQAGLAPNQTTAQISSAMFIVKAAADSATTSSISVSSSLATMSTSAISTTSGSTPSIANSPPMPTNNSHSRLSTGAVAGIAIGGILGAIAFIAAGWFLARRKPKTDGNASSAATTGAGGASQQEKDVARHSTQPVPPYSQQPYHEFDAMQSNRQNAPAELGNSYMSR